MVKKLSLHIALIAVLTSLIYLPSLRNGFIWDDDAYVYNNVAVQSPDGLQDIWFSYEMPQYYPVVFTSFWVEHQLWGLDPYGYHVVNLAIHVVNAILVYLILLRLYPPLALAVALLFAMHPVQVETVAWVSERKNLLGGLFYLLAILFYLRFFDRGRRKDYLCSFASFVLALLSKSITVSFVVVPLLLRWWRKEKLSRQDLLALLPFAVVGLASGINTVYLEIYKVGAQGGAWSLSLLEHVLLPGQIILFYAYKILLPSELIFFYPRWQIDPHQFGQWLPLVAVIALGAVLFLGRERIGRGAFSNYLYFLCAIFPALGFFNVYPMQFSWVADHFQYLASINLIILFAGGGMWLGNRLLSLSPGLPQRWRGGIGYAVLFFVVGLYGAGVIEHSRAFANLEVQWREVLGKNPASWAAHNNLGAVYQRQGRLEDAIVEFKKGVELYPEYVTAHNNLGICYLAVGRLDDAMGEFRTVLKLDPNHADAYDNMGLVLLDQGREDEAYPYFRQAAQLAPRLSQVRYRLASYHLAREQYDEAIEELLAAVEADPTFLDAMQSLAQTFEAIAQPDNALYWYERALAVDFNNPLAHNSIGIIQARRGAVREAMAEFQRALAVDPDYVPALLNAANAYHLLGDDARALPYVRRLAQLGVDLSDDLYRLQQLDN